MLWSQQHSGRKKTPKVSVYDPLRGFSTDVAPVLFCILYFIFTPSYREYISCTILISTRLFKLRVHKKKKLEWRRAHYSKTNYGALTGLTLFYYSFVVH